MIRIRDRDLKLLELGPLSPAFVELCSVDGKLARVLCSRDDGSVEMFGPGDEVFTRYLKLTGSEPSEVTLIE